MEYRKYSRPFSATDDRVKDAETFKPARRRRVDEAAAEIARRVDRIIRQQTAVQSKRTVMPTATETRIRTALGQSKPMTASEVADRLPWSTRTVRRHLDAMVAVGTVEQVDGFPARYRKATS